MTRRRRPAGAPGALATIAALVALASLGLALTGPVPAAVGAADGPGTAGSSAARLDARLPALMERYDVPGVGVAVVRDGELAWSAAYGHADAARDRPMTTDRVFRTESISKPVTAWAVMRLVEQGRIGLDDPVAQHLTSWELPGPPGWSDDVTVRRLLSHSSGMALGSIGEQYPPTGDIPSLAEHLGRQARLVDEPGAGFRYSNPGFDVLELLIEDVTGRDFAGHMAEEVLEPLGMASSSFAWSEELAGALASGHDLRGDPVDPYVYPSMASGGLLATVDDVGRFVAAGLADPTDRGGAVLSPRGVGELATPTVDMAGVYRAVADAHGLGYFVETMPDGRDAVFYGGQGNGWLTHLHAVPATGDGIVVLTNSQRSWPLIAHMLRDWTDARGLPSVGMSRIVAATTGLWVVIGLIAALSVGQAWRVARRLRRREGRPAPPSRAGAARRAVAGGLAVGVTAALVWAVTRDYLFVTSVFPVAAPWLGVALAGAAVALALTALLPAPRIAPTAASRPSRPSRPSASGATASS